MTMLTTVPDPRLVERLAQPTGARRLAALDAWWRANNYLTVGQIYLQGNPLLREPLRPTHIKPRLLGHWGTSPGLSFVYAHVSRLIQAHRPGGDLPRRTRSRRSGAGRGAATWRAPTPRSTRTITQDETGVLRLFRQFSAPGRHPQPRVGAPRPGSIHEGGELGYVLVHAFGAVMDNPDLHRARRRRRRRGRDRPAGGLVEGRSRSSTPTRDGAVLPILHLNGAKIAGPTVLGRKDPAEVRSLLEGHGYDVIEVEGDGPARHAPPVRRGAGRGVGRRSARSRRRRAAATGTAAVRAGR